MSKTKTVVLVVTAVLVVCLIGAGVVLMAKLGGSFVSIPDIFAGKSGLSTQIDEAQDLDLSGVDAIKVDCVSGEIIIAPGAPRVELTGNITTNMEKEQYLVVEKAESALSVRFDAQATYPGFVNGEIKMRIWLPESIAASLDVSGASSNIDLQGITLGDLRLSSASGTISVKDCGGEKLDAGAVSGAVRLESARFATVGVTCTSGSVYAADIAGDMMVGNVSGSVRVENAAGKVKINNTSGSAYVSQSHKEIAEISIETVSGSAQLALNPEASFNLTAHSISGSISTDYDVLVSGPQKKGGAGESLSGSVNGGGERVRVSTVSGSIRIGKQ